MQLDANRILADAAALSGLTVSLDGPTRAGFDEILRAFNEEADLPAQMSVQVAAQLTGLVANHQRIYADRRAHPEIARARIERPLIVCGMPRSGTTMLHCLLGEDPSNRAPLLWERYFPSPPPGHDDNVATRREWGDAAVQQILDAMPRFLTAHPYWDALGQATAECDDFMQLTFASLYFAAFHHVPGYSRWLATVDFTPYYEFHKAYLQNLQWGAPKARWALKGVSHGYYADEVKQAYPDAVMIWPHRDIVAQLASNLELGAIVRTIEDPEERAVVASDWLDYTEAGLRRGLASPLFDDADFLCHVSFDDLVSRPVETVRAIYHRYDIPFADDLPARIEAWLADPANRPDRYGKFSYELSHFGVDADELAERFAFYGRRLGDRLAGGLSVVR
jgi:hypothetical protein